MFSVMNFGYPQLAGTKQPSSSSVRPARCGRSTLQACCGDTLFGYRKILPVHSSASKTAKCRNLHCLALLNKAIFRQCPRVNKECITVTSIAAAVKGNARHKAAALHLILKFADNIGRKVLTTAGIRAVIIHVGAQIAFQCALRFSLAA